MLKAPTSYICRRFIRAVLQGFLPGLALKLFLTFLPQVLMLLTKFEGHVSLSTIEKYAATKYFVFMVVNVFFGNVIVGSLFEQLKQYISAPTKYVLSPSFLFVFAREGSLEQET